MQILDDITAEARQRHSIITSDGSVAVLELTYMPTQLGWFADVLHEKSGWSAHGLRITANGNILSQWQDIIPFGIICWTEDGYEPMLPEDFLAGRATLAVITANEAAELSELEMKQQGW